MSSTFPGAVDATGLAIKSLDPYWGHLFGKPQCYSRTHRARSPTQTQDPRAMVPMWTVVSPMGCSVVSSVELLKFSTGRPHSRPLKLASLGAGLRHECVLKLPR